MRWIALCAALLLAACAAPVEHNTRSGRPEATFNTSLQRTHSIILNALVDRRYQITRDSPNLIVADRPSDNVAANVLLGSQWNPIVNARLSITIIENSPTSTRAVADLGVITNPGSGFEKSMDMNRSQDSAVIQNWLNSLAAQSQEVATQ